MKNNHTKSGLVPLLVICWNTSYQNLIFRKIAEIASTGTKKNQILS